jgi:hypothetical protein
MKNGSLVRPLQAGLDRDSEIRNASQRPNFIFHLFSNWGFLKIS